MKSLKLVELNQELVKSILLQFVEDYKRQTNDRDTIRVLDNFLSYYDMEHEQKTFMYGSYDNLVDRISYQKELLN